MKIKTLSPGTITIIQLSIATTLSLVFQFIIPLWWQPLDYYTHGGKINHGDPGANVTFFTVSLWFFTLSIAWLFYRDNKYLNNFIVYALVPLGMIVADEFFVILLFFDYIHVFPFVVAIYLIWKKKDTLDQKLLPYYLVLFSSWIFSVYFLKLAYYSAPLNQVIFNWAIPTALSILLSFTFRKKQKLANKYETK